MYYPARAIRTERYKYIVNFRPNQPLILEPHIITQCGEQMVNQYYSSPLPGEELYALQEDPHEFHNLANNLHYGQVRRDLRSQLFTYLRQSKDPLLDGPVTDPSGDHTPARTFERLWRRTDDGLYEIDLPPIWQNLPGQTATEKML